MRILVAGKTGQVARSLVAASSSTGLEIVAPGRPQLDLERPDSLVEAIDACSPDIVVNAAAYTAVDKAEQEEDAAFAVNAAGAGHLARACADAGIPIIHISTDYVFDGSKLEPYLEDDPTAPLGAYGRSKLDGERLVAAANPRHVIVRTAWVVSPYGNNFVKTMLRLAETRPELGVVDDQTGSPTYAPHLAGAIIAVARQVAGADKSSEHWGTYHACGRGFATWCQLAREVFGQAAAHRLATAQVRAITTADYPTPARRPANSRLDCSKLARQFGVRLPDWQTGVEECVRGLSHGQEPTAFQRGDGRTT